MAKLFIAEYGGVARLSSRIGDEAPVGQEVSLDQTPLAIGGASVQSEAFQNNTRIVRIHTDAICSVAFGLDPTATVDNKRMAANTTEYFGVRPGDKLAVISNV